jgi:plasmid stabilization system protein ParE
LVVWTETAKNSLKQIHDFIALDSGYYAKEVVENILHLAEELVDLPRRGRIVPERQQDNLRELFLYSYRIIYRISDPDIVVLTVLHGKRDSNTALTDLTPT